MTQCAVPTPTLRPTPGDRLLATKINPPATTPEQVLRSAVCDRIAGANAAKLTLVRAPAGFGKTTAMLQARNRLSASGIDCAWLTLDRADNDASRFLACLAAALGRLMDEPFTSRTPLEAVERIASHDAPFMLFLDEFEAIQEPAVMGLVREIIDHLPRRGQLVIGSRSLPDLGLGRLRARGQLVEIDVDDLRFTVDETVEFFHLRRMEALPAEALLRLHRKTEGWVAAIWLASLTLEQRGTGSDFIDRFSGTHRAVAEYLAQDVLAQQPPEIRDFLLRTSILRHLDAPLCQALNPRHEGGRILERIEAANLFLTPIVAPSDGGERSWRYHSLFAHFLRSRLARDQPDEYLRLHLAASGWYEAQGRPVPAIDHAIEGGDHPHALALLGMHVRRFLEQGRMRLLARWFAAVPEAALRSQPLLQVAAVWAACFTHGPWEAMALLEDSGGTCAADTAVLAHVNALRPLLLAMMDRYEDADAVGRASLARLPTCEPFADTVLANAMAHILATLGQDAEAHRLLEKARRASSDGAFNRMYSDSEEGVLDLREGRLRQATARFRMAVNATHSASYSPTNGNAWAGVLYAGALYEANRLDETEHLLNVYLPLARDVGLPDHMISSHWMLARIAFLRGDIDQAFQVLTELEYLGHHRQLPRVVASAKLERARLLLLQGRADASRDELARADDRPVWIRVRAMRLPAHDVDTIEFARLRHELSFGDPTAAVPQIRAELAMAEDQGLHRRSLKLRVLLALALGRSGQAGAAVDAMAQVLRQASQEGFVRLILDEGEAVGPLIRRVACEAPRSPIFAEYLQRLVKVLAPVAVGHDARDAASPVANTATPEPLTRKEIRVLQLLAEGYSNNAMAERLFVSDSTVRTHLRNINMKLGAQSRTQAVAIARRLELLR